MANKVHDTLGVAVSYVVGSPSSYAYPDASRPDAQDGSFQPFIDAQNCTTYHRWPYGMQARAGYAAAVSDDQLRAQLVARPITYLLGGLDTTPEFGFDSTCPAMAQGPSRLCAGPVVPEADGRQVRREAHARRGPRLRPQRPLRLHVGRGVASCWCHVAKAKG